MEQQNQKITNPQTPLPKTGYRLRLITLVNMQVQRKMQEGRPKNVKKQSGRSPIINWTVSCLLN
jgi:hypothetical protein